MGKENEGDFSFIVFPLSGTRKVNDTGAAATAVRAQLNKLSAIEGDELVNHLAAAGPDNFQVRSALTIRGAPATIRDLPNRNEIQRYRGYA
jgi:hypothetical protein